MLDLLQLLHQVLRDELEGLGVGLAGLCVADAPDNLLLSVSLGTYAECIDELVEREAAVRGRLRHVDVHAALRRLVVLPELGDLEHDLFQILERDDDRVNFAQLTEFEELDR